MYQRLEALEQEAADQGILLDETILKANTPLDGLYIAWGPQEAIILLNGHRPLSIRVAALAEELGAPL